MNKNNYCIIMAGGTGTRFWPLSRLKKPKQFLDILNTGKTLIQHTYNRIANLFPRENIYVITHEDYLGLVTKQLPELSESQILVEPVRKNTAPCIAYVTHRINAINENARTMFCPSDHLILNTDDFKIVVEKALNFIDNNPEALLTIGLKPLKPETNYGYIQASGDLSSIVYNETTLKVKTFIEKPDRDMAKLFIESGDFFWNSGIFFWTSKACIKAFEEFLPDINLIFKEGQKYFYTNEEENLIKECYSRCKNISVDYGILEKSKNVFVLCADFGWSDLGSWSSLEEIFTSDKNKNILLHKNIFIYDSDNCTVFNPDKEKLIVIEGLKNYIVAETRNILLICSKGKEHLIKRFINDLKIEGKEDYL